MLYLIPDETISRITSVVFIVTMLSVVIETSKDQQDIERSTRLQILMGESTGCITIIAWSWEAILNSILSHPQNKRNGSILFLVIEWRLFLCKYLLS